MTDLEFQWIKHSQPIPEGWQRVEHPIHHHNQHGVLAMRELDLFPPSSHRERNGRFAPVYRAEFVKTTQKLKSEVKRMEARRGLAFVHGHFRKIGGKDMGR